MEISPEGSRSMAAGLSALTSSTSRRREPARIDLREPAKDDCRLSPLLAERGEYSPLCRMSRPEPFLLKSARELAREIWRDSDGVP